MKVSYKRSAAVLLAAAIAVVSAGSVSRPVYAETTLERLQKAKAEKEKTEDAKEDTEDRKESLEITKNSLLGQLSTLNDELAQVSANLEGIEADIVEKELQIEQTEAQLEEAVRLQDEQYENMKLRIKAMYEQGGTDGYLSILFSSSGFSDFLNKSDYIDRVHAYDRKMLKKFQDTCKYVEETRVRLNEELVALNDLKAEAEEEKSRVAGLVSQTSANVSSYTSQIADAEATINALESMLDEQEQDIAALQKQYEEELAKSRLASHSKWRDISEVTFEEGDRKLMANIIYCEAGGEPYEGQVAVGAVVINRVLSSVYPNTVVGVIYQNKQFSPVASGRLALALTNDKATESCYRAADEAMSGVTNVGQCVYFRTPIPGLEGIRIGGHIFY
ncbi:MAG: cell wall hydrolase [Lachnospiraceae bacterium]|nr:cell wall hydrolase [Lachnospiraceae bacterium]MDE7414881.1 cell wall hydrolase [Lachnospiraceae bacterium]